LTRLDRSSKHKFSLRRSNPDTIVYRAMALMWLLFVVTAIYEFVKVVLK
jgi:hypothetical protein